MEGAPITELANEHRFDLPQRLRLFTEACEAVACLSAPGTPRGPAGRRGLSRGLVRGIGEVALALARDHPGPGMDREALLLDLVQLRKDDRDGAFEFVPGLLARRDLSDSERERLTSALGHGVQDGQETGRDRGAGS